MLAVGWAALCHTAAAGLLCSVVGSTTAHLCATNHHLAVVALPVGFGGKPCCSNDCGCVAEPWSGWGIMPFQSEAIGPWQQRCGLVAVGVEEMHSESRCIDA